MPEITQSNYVEFVRRRVRFIGAATAAALLTAGVVCLLLPKRYTAAATLLIEPPGTGDPRVSTAISPAYLESLKSFEQLASSDSLFLRTAQQFNLLNREGESSVERLKRRVLVVEKIKDTRLMRISVTLRDAPVAQHVAQFLAEQTTLLNRELGQEGDRELAEDLARQTAVAKARLDRSREAGAGVSGLRARLERETTALRELKGETQRQALDATAEAADLSAQEAAVKAQASATAGDVADAGQKAAGARARRQALDANVQEVSRQLAEQESSLAEVVSRNDRAQAEIESARAALAELEKRANELASVAGLRSEQLRIVDRGIVPQRPSSPDIPLVLAAALVLSLAGTLLFLTLQFRFSQGSARPLRTEFRVARGGR